MKTSKILTAGILAATALVSTASAVAPTKIYITGSTAFRSVSNPQISALLSGTVTIASSDPSIGSANAAMWTGGKIGTIDVTIKAAWTGSAAGIQAVAANGLQSVQTKFLVDGATGTANLDPNDLLNPNPSFELATPDVCMADNVQGSTPFLGGSSINGSVDNYQTLTPFQVGVVSFTWAASNGFPAGMSMNKKLVEKQFAGTGALLLGAYTGIATDMPKVAPWTNVVYATGRNPGSGTRIVTLAESGYGIDTFVSQWQPTSSGQNGTVSSMVLYPQTIINGVDTVQDGNSGEETGGVLRDFLTNTLGTGARQNSETGSSYLITYLGVGDYNKVKSGASGITKPAVPLKWNGVDFSQLAVQTGQYTFWGYEYLMYRPNLGTGAINSGNDPVKLTFASNLKTNILAATSATLSPNVALSDMRVTRAGDGGPVGNPNF